MDRWWANCVRNEEERQWIGNLVKKVRMSQDGYVFTRQDYEQLIAKRAETGQLEIPRGEQTVDDA